MNGLTEQEIDTRIKNLTIAIAQGATSISEDGKSISYRSISDMKQAIDFLKGLKESSNSGRNTAGISYITIEN